MNPLNWFKTKLQLWALIGAASLFLVSTGALGIVLWGVKSDLKRANVTITKTEGERDEANRLLGVCQASQTALQAAIDDQNAAVARLKAEAATAEEIGLRRLAEAQAEARRYKNRAETLAKAKPGPDQCGSAKDLIVKTLGQERGQ